MFEISDVWGEPEEHCGREMVLQTLSLRSDGAWFGVLWLWDDAVMCGLVSICLEHLISSVAVVLITVVGTSNAIYQEGAKRGKEGRVTLGGGKCCGAGHVRCNR